LVIDAASFGVSAVLLALTAPRPSPHAVDPTAGGDPGRAAASYVDQLWDGWRYLRGDGVLLAITAMVSVTNLLDLAFVTVLVPVWAEDSGGGASAVGLFFALFSGAAILGSLVASAWGARLPRYRTYVVAFLVAGLPRFVVMALAVPLVGVLGVAVIGGFACGFINPILGAVVFERIPEPLVGRVTSLSSALCWCLVPFGGLLGGSLVAAVGLEVALVAVGAAYLAATLSPLLVPAWRTIDERPPAPERVPVPVG
jgi:MFS family permease